MKAQITISLLLAAFAGAETTTLQCRLLSLQTRPSGPAALYAGSGETAIRCDLPREEFTQPLDLTVTDGRIVFRGQPDVNSQPAAIATVPRGLKGALLLFVPPAAEDSKHLYRIVVLDDSLRGLPENGSLVFNASPAQIRYLMGDQHGMAKPGQISAVTRPQKRDDFQMSGVIFQTQAADRWKTSYESVLRFPENLHRLFVVYRDPISNQPDLRIVRFTPR